MRHFLFFLFITFIISTTINLNINSNYLANNLFAAENFQNLDPLSFSTKINPIKNTNKATLIININLEEGYFAYYERLNVNSNNPYIKFSPLEITPLIEFTDPNSKKIKKGINKEAQITTQITFQSLPTKPSLDFFLHYQICSEKFCLFPQQVPFSIPTPIINTKSLKIVKPGFFDLSQYLNFSQAHNLQIWYLLLIIFVAGILTSFTPCIFPMIPVTLAIIGISYQNSYNLYRRFLFSLFYILGISVTYSSLGIIASLTGSLFGSYLQNPFVLSIIFFFLLLMALSMFGFFDLNITFINKLQNNNFFKFFNTKPFLKAFSFGILTGLMASPCVSPVLISILTLAANTQNIFQGFILLFVYALGMGQIFILLALSTKILNFLPKSGSWLEITKFIFGLSILLIAFYLINSLISFHALLLLISLTLIIIALLWLILVYYKKIFPVLNNAFPIILFFLGLTFLSLFIFNQKNAIIKNTETLQNWQKFSFDEFNQAMNNKKNIIIDFYADWCISCKKLKNQTLSSPKIINYTKDFVLFKMDVTTQSEDFQKLQKTYKIKGLPTVLFFTSGKWLKHLTLNQFENENQFLQRLQQF